MRSLKWRPSAPSQVARQPFRRRNSRPMQRLLLIGVRDESGILPALDMAGYRCRSAPPEDNDLLRAFEAQNPDALVLELAEDILLLHHVRRVLRSAFNARPLPVFALVRPVHLDPPHLVVGVDDFLVAPF